MMIYIIEYNQRNFEKTCLILLNLFLESISNSWKFLNVSNYLDIHKKIDK